MTNRIYFITGTTGFLGGEVLRTILAEDPNAQCYCLVRANSQDKMLVHSEKIFPIIGDITQDNLGMSTQDYQDLSKKITHIIHSAAVVQFEKPIVFLDNVNVRGTKNVIAFAKACQQHNPDFKVLSHVSTAYVAGKRKGVVREQDFSDAYGFKNNYETTKYASEKLLHEVKNTLPVIIFRPSIILGHSQDGRTLSTNVLFPIAQVIKRYSHKTIPVPVNKNCLLDLVAVDYVAQGIYFLTQCHDAVGQVFHLTSGQGNELTVKELANIFGEIYQKQIIFLPSQFEPLFAWLLSYNKKGKYIMKAAAPFHLYTVANPQFCQQATQKLLDQFGIRCNKTDDVLKKTLLFMEK